MRSSRVTRWLSFPTALRSQVGRGLIVVLTVSASILTQRAAAAETESPASPQAAPNFVRDVMPVLVKAGCAGGKCHGSFQGRGGFQLSLFGFDPPFDHEALTREARQRRIFVAAPADSLILRKATGRLPHGGGKRFEVDSDSYRILHDWVQRGSAEQPDFDLHVTGIEVEPSELILAPEQSRRLRVLAHWSDGTVRDVTEWAIYEARDESCAEPAEDGTITARRSGRTSVTVSFFKKSAAVTVTVPYGDLAADETPEPAAFPPHNYIDELIAAEWKKIGLRPAPLADDYEFLRRVSLDLTGTLPTRERIEAFVASTDADKRAKVIDELLESGEYVDYWAHHWADLLRVHRRYLGDKGMWSFWNWVRRAVRENWPVDRIARELITARGDLFANGATAYYFIDEDPAQLAETTAQLFLGVRLSCAKCHHHPYEVWSQQDYYGLASFFTRIEVKDNGDGARYGGAKLLRPLSSVNKSRRLKMAMDPTLLGQPVDPAKIDDVRTELADWITSNDNPFFTRSFVNRYWARLMGRGLVEPVDDLRATNPPSMPELFEALNADFVAHDNNVKHLLRTICNSRVYQLASRASSQVDRDGMFYSHRRYSRLPAAVMLDAVSFATGTSESFTGLPAGTRAIELPDPTIPSYFLQAFGRSVRSSPCECATSNDPDLAQALHLVNSDSINGKLTAGGSRLDRLLQAEMDDTARVDELFFVTRSRPPSAEERKIALALIDQAEDRNTAFQDLLWALLNSTEFVFNH